MLDILILLGLAVFFISRLRKVLGKEIDDNPVDFTKKPRSNQERVIHLRDRQDKPGTQKVPEDDAPILADIGDPEVTKGLTAIKTAEPSFNVREFLMGAKAAFEMILGAYNKGDKQALQPLLGKEVYLDFEADIDAKTTQEICEENTLVAITSADIVKARLEGKRAEITVHFTTEQLTVMRNKQNEIVGGDASTSHLVSDEWIFVRDVKSSDPNWILIAT